MNTPKTKRQILSIVLLYGSIWGLLEATVGYVLHWVPALISGSVMVPIALLIVRHGYLQTQSRKSVFLMGVVAAAVKSVNLFLPNITIWKAINPMVAILIEALLAALVVGAFDKNKLPKTAALIGVVSIGWRGAFVLYQALNGAWTGSMAPYLLSVSAVAEFILLQGLFTWVFAMGAYFLSIQVERFTFDKAFRPLYAASSFALAVLATILIR